MATAGRSGVGRARRATYIQLLMQALEKAGHPHAPRQRAAAPVRFPQDRTWTAADKRELLELINTYRRGQRAAGGAESR
ncbi:MAG: hypothetical protein MZW92_38835 [Comamonadaceae bacterium]|nr:hypothetical protein [Comamonadaceae bacterium]